MSFDLEIDEDENGELNVSNADNSTDENKRKPENKGCILYAAPTGKAASATRKKSNKEAHTMNSAHASHSHWKGRRTTDAWKFANTEILAVDETSMVGLVVSEEYRLAL